MTKQHEKKKLLLIEDCKIMRRAFFDTKDYYPFSLFEFVYCSCFNEFNKVKNIMFDVCMCDWRIWESIYDNQERLILGHQYLDIVKAKKKYIFTSYYKQNDIKRYAELNGIHIFNKDTFKIDTLEDIYKGLI